MLISKIKNKTAFISMSLIIIILILIFLISVLINAKRAILEAQRVSIGWSNERGDPEDCKAIEVKTDALKNFKKSFKDNEYCLVIFTYNKKNDNKFGQTDFTVNFWTDVIADVLVVAGGGGGGSTTNEIKNSGAGGGGAGGVVFKKDVKFEDNIKYYVAIGNGGEGGDKMSSYRGYNGKNSQFGDIIAYGGGGGGASSNNEDLNSGLSGGSGGGAGNWGGRAGKAVGSQGYNGGNANDIMGSASGGGGGGSGAEATFRTTSWQIPGSGGKGIENNITGSKVIYARGGNGGWYYDSVKNINQNRIDSGDGGDGASDTQKGSNGFPGIIIIRYKISRDL